MNADGLKWAAPIATVICGVTTGIVVKFAMSHNGFVGVEKWANAFSDKELSEARQSMLAGIRGVHGSTGDSDDAVQALGAWLNGMDQWRSLQCRKFFIGWCKFSSAWTPPIATILAGISSYAILMENSVDVSKKYFVACLVVAGIFALTCLPFIYYMYRSEWKKS